MKQIKVTKKIQKYAETLHQATKGENLDINTLNKLVQHSIELHKLLAHKKFKAYLQNV